MNDIKQRIADLSQKTSVLLGRETEIDFFTKAIMESEISKFIYYKAGGGFGKTRLLQEFIRVVNKCGKNYRSTGIIDLYHTDTHSTSDVENLIVDSIDPEREYFKEYRRQRQIYKRVNELGSDTEVIEALRESLSKIFVDEFNLMALHFFKLVILLDTIELIQYESSAVEKQASLNQLDARVKAWLLSKLSCLKNTVIVFAGRPKEQSTEQRSNHQAQLEDDMRDAFGKNRLIIRPVIALTEEQTRQFITLLSSEKSFEDDLLPLAAVIHRLTAGKPIFLHLLVDLIKLNQEPNTIIELLQDFETKGIIHCAEGDQPLSDARNAIQEKILETIFNEEDEVGAKLIRIGFLPKGFDAEILQAAALAITPEEASELIALLRGLSFVKQFIPPKGLEPRLHEERLFYHDEVYTLLYSKKRPSVKTRLRLNTVLTEQQTVSALNNSYYLPKIKLLENDLDNRKTEIDDRVKLRDRLNKLQVEQLYYLLVINPVMGFERYKELTQIACRRHWVGFSMRLLDEFLRFYNNLDRRAAFETKKINHRQVIRESVELWVERFWWWGRTTNLIELAEAILEHPDQFEMDPEENLPAIANACARWGNFYARLYGYRQNAEIIMLEKRIQLIAYEKAHSSSEQALLAHARLSNAIGFHYSQGSFLQSAASYYLEAKTLFFRYGHAADELALVLNNLAFVYAQQGRFELALPLIEQALKINARYSNLYSTGRTLSTMAVILGRQGIHDRAIRVANEALQIFNELNDTWGKILALKALAYAQRRKAKLDIRQDRNQESAAEELEHAARTLDEALEYIEQGKFISRKRDVLAERGRVYRELAVTSRINGEAPEKVSDYFTKSRDSFEAALSLKPHNADPAVTPWNTLSIAETYEDMAEGCLGEGTYDKANDHLKKVEALLKDYLIPIADEGSKLPVDRTAVYDLAPSEYYLPLGKVQRLRGELAFKQNNPEKALRYFYLAYVYFNHFSQNSAEKDRIIGMIYSYQDEGSANLLSLLDNLRSWIRKNGIAEYEQVFIDNLTDLFGQEHYI